MGARGRVSELKRVVAGGDVGLRLNPPSQTVVLPFNHKPRIKIFHFLLFSFFHSEEIQQCEIFEFGFMRLPNLRGKAIVASSHQKLTIFSVSKSLISSSFYHLQPHEIEQKL